MKKPLALAILVMFLPLAHAREAEPADADNPVAVLLDLVSKSNGKIHPLELLPDIGASPAKRVEGKAATVIQARSVLRVKPDTALPEALTTTLGKPIRVGDLEVTPLKVEQKRVLFKHRSGKYKPELSEHEALFLHLQMKNVSKDSEFCPTDPVFDYLWNAGRHPENAMPYTFLEVAANGKRFCGPFKIPARKKKPDNATSDEYAEGQEDHLKVLKPGEELKTVILTEPTDRVPLALKDHQDKLLWRVQLRRGLVVVNGREFSTTAVIGVQFHKGQIAGK